MERDGSKVIKYLYSIMVAIVVGLFLYTNWQDYKIVKLEEDVANVEMSIRLQEANHEVELFEEMESVIFEKEKECNVSEIPTNIGHHTIDF